MSWDEKLFGWAWSAARALGRARPTAAEAARAATLAVLSERLRIIATALAEEPLELREAEQIGGFVGRVLRLPARIALAPTLEGNEDVYVLRVAWSVTAMRADLVLSADIHDPLERLFGAALAAVHTRARLVEMLPGALERFVAVEALELAARPPLAVRPSAARALELLVRARLGDTAACSAGATNEQAWLQAALPHAPSDGRALSVAVRELAAGLHALDDSRVRAVAPQPPIVWGAVGAHDALALASSTGSPATSEGLPSGTELRARPKEQLRRVELPSDPVQDNPLVHSFEKVHTAEEYKGGSKNTDGADELDDHAAALDELDLREVIRSTDRTQSLLRCDVMLEGTAGDLAEAAPDEGGIPYDEWHEKERRYRSAWCRVRPTLLAPRVAKSEALAYVAGLRGRGARRIEAIRAELARIEHARRWRARQLDGPEVDEDAVVDRLAALRSGHSGPDRLYRSRRRHAPELAVVLLLDASLSTDGWIADRRVLDVELEAALCIAEALDGSEVELGVATFHSHTRRDCRFTVVKGLDEAWPAVRDRLASIEPTGYTRIGPALRHATRVLDRTRAQRRLLLLLTDGKPNDYDRYEGRYGIADVRQAVREADRDGVHVHALAFDREARFYLPQMFGRTRHSVVSSPDQLPLAIGRVCAEMWR